MCVHVRLCRLCVLSSAGHVLDTRPLQARGWTWQPVPLREPGRLLTLVHK